VSPDSANKVIHMKKFIILSQRILWAILYAVVLLPIVVSAQSSYSGITNPLNGGSDIAALVKKVLETVVKIGVPLAAIFIVYSGFQFVTAAGNKTKIEDAKKTFFYTVIGTAILLGAWVIAETLDETVRSLG